MAEEVVRGTFAEEEDMMREIEIGGSQDEGEEGVRDDHCQRGVSRGEREKEKRKKEKEKRYATEETFFPVLEHADGKRVGAIGEDGRMRSWLLTDFV